MDGFMSRLLSIVILLFYYFRPVSYIFLINIYLSDTLEKLFNIPQLKILFSVEKYNNLFNFLSLSYFYIYIKTSLLIKNFLKFTVLRTITYVY